MCKTDPPHVDFFCSILWDIHCNAGRKNLQAGSVWHDKSSTTALDASSQTVETFIANIIDFFVTFSKWKCVVLTSIVKFAKCLKACNRSILSIPYKRESDLMGIFLSFHWNWNRNRCSGGCRCQTDRSHRPTRTQPLVVCNCKHHLWLYDITSTTINSMLWVWKFQHWIDPSPRGILETSPIQNKWLNLSRFFI